MVSIIKMDLSKIFALIFVLSQAIVSTAHAQKLVPKGKNILVMYSDDQGYNTLRILGNKEIYTPNLDPVKSVRSSIYNIYGHWSRSIKNVEGFKMILYNVKGKLTTQLFNLKNDPWEMHDLSGDLKFAKKYWSCAAC